MSGFKSSLADRVSTLAVEFGLNEFALPVALVLVVDAEHGGDAVAEELVKRFRLLDAESTRIMDFYFLGWRQEAVVEGSQTLRFDLAAFEEFRGALRRAGIVEFGGYADLILCDAWYRQRRVSLDFSSVIHVDLSRAAKQGTIDTLASFLQGLIEFGEKFRSQQASSDVSPTFWISDRLGIAVARQSLIDFILEKWGKFLGAPRLALLSVRALGPSVDLARL